MVQYRFVTSFTEQTTES